MSSKNNQTGFTIAELLITISIMSVTVIVFDTIFRSTVNPYFSLQREGANFTDLAAQSQRVAKVLRGLTDITSASANEIIIYGYFAPTDTYVSLVRYYKNPANTALLADVTQMTSNPPIGTPIPTSLKTYTVFENYYQVPSIDLFAYLDSAGALLTLPISDLKTIKGIRVNLAVPKDIGGGHQDMNLQVSLRNRKTNL